MPNTILGCSAGAAVAAALVTNTTEKALQSCKDLYASNPRMLLPHQGNDGAWNYFAQNKIYPNWLRSFFGADELQMLRSKCFRVTASKLNPAYGKKKAILHAIVKHVFAKDQFGTGKNNKRSPSPTGLIEASLDLSACKELSEALLFLEATATAAPFISGRKIKNDTYFDGGYISSIPELTDQKQSEHPTSITLLTSYSKHRPLTFVDAGRLYIQPSKLIPVSTWGCTATTRVDAAFNLGQQDAQQLTRKL